MRLGGREALAYILHKMGCIHPFTASRVLALAELLSLEASGERLTELTYRAGPGVFYIEEFKEIIEGDSCFAKHEGDPATGMRGCIEYRCSPPQLPPEPRRLLDKAIEEAKRRSDAELNKFVVNHPLFAKLVGQEQG